MFSLNVQIMQPYCPCCQFCHPFQIPSYLPTYLPATSLPACFYHLLCHLYACSSTGVNVLMTAQISPLSQSTKLSGVSCGVILFEFGMGRKLTKCQGSGRYFNFFGWFCCFPLISYNVQLWPISVKMASHEHCAWPVGGT